MRITGLLILLLVSCYAGAQNLIPWKEKDLQLRDSLRIDTLPLLPGTVSVFGSEGKWQEGKDFSIRYHEALLINLRPQPEKIHIRYQLMPENIARPVFLRDRREADERFLIGEKFQAVIGEKNMELFPEEGFARNGSISRGIAFGNNQDLVVNSSLNLQLSGYLTEDVSLVAAITDDNNPIQPEGNTQQLQDFDRVYVQLNKDSNQLTLGDFEMTRPDGYFMNFYKKSRGLQVKALNAGKNYRFTATGEGAFSRGRFSRNVFQASEGNLGPYRLSGSNGETFIIIIAGTEQVYLDGKRLQRGEQNDYIIDYNAGELVFMPTVTITGYSRIVVEFQYADRNYFRSVYRLSSNYEYKRFKAGFHFFHEQDNKRQPVLEETSSQDRTIMAAAGDNLAAALAPGATRVSQFTADRVVYRQIDTAGFTGVYVRALSASEDTVFYDVNFAYVGPGLGDYEPAAAAANGRVYQWIAPAGGQRQGSYLPLQPLTTPKLNQMMVGQLGYRIAKGVDAGVEVAVSRNDINLFSDKDKQNDWGTGLFAFLQSKRDLGKKPGNYWKTLTRVERIDKNFRYVERYRPVEFDRMFNRQLQNQVPTDTSGELYANSQAEFSFQAKHNVQAQVAHYSRDSGKNAWLQSLRGNTQWKGFLFNAETELVQTDDTTIKGNYYRLASKLARPLPYVVPGLQYAAEQSAFRNRGEQLQNGSYRFNEWTAFLENPDTLRLLYRLSYTERRDELNDTLRFLPVTLGKTWQLKLGRTAQIGNYNLSVTYRTLSVDDTLRTSLRDEESLQGRLEWDIRFWKKSVQYSSYYQTGTGQELRRDFVYLEVQPGRGTHAWIDYNSNGLQEINEFEVSVFPDQAKYLRVQVPTAEFVRTNSVQLNQTLGFTPSLLFKNPKGFRRFISRWSTLLSIRSDRKAADQISLVSLNPADLKLDDPGLITANAFFRGTVFFNRVDPVFGADYTYLDNLSKQFLSYGFDAKRRVEHQMKFRWNLSRSYTFQLEATAGDRRYISDFFAGRSYRYDLRQTFPQLSWQRDNQLRITVGWKWSESKERGGTATYSTQQEYQLEARYNFLTKGLLSARYSYATVKFNGSTEANSPIGFDMLQGLQPGVNMLWNISYQYRVNKHLQVNVNYDGRVTGKNPVVHLGRAEVRYVF